MTHEAGSPSVVPTSLSSIAQSERLTERLIVVVWIALPEHTARVPSLLALHYSIRLLTELSPRSNWEFATNV